MSPLSSPHGCQQHCSWAGHKAPLGCHCLGSVWVPQGAASLNLSLWNRNKTRELPP